jgi:hypothetical protein
MFVATAEMSKQCRLHLNICAWYMLRVGVAVMLGVVRVVNMKHRYIKWIRYNATSRHNAIKMAN